MVNHLVGNTGNMFWLGMSKIESKTQKDIWDDGTRAEFNNYGENEPSPNSRDEGECLKIQGQGLFFPFLQIFLN